jgi:hypothetical protein
MAAKRKPKPVATAQTPVTKLVRTSKPCREELHLWCPGTVGKQRIYACLCPCHKGVVSKLRAAR